MCHLLRCAPRESLIIASSDCSHTWIARMFPPFWFGGEIGICFDPVTKDATPVRFDSDYKPAPRVLS
jgi:hypothetical protein